MGIPAFKFNDLRLDRRLLNWSRTNPVKTVLKLAAVALLSGIAIPAATLEYLSLDEMALKATSIVRARVTGSYAAAGPTLIYTHYRVQVLDRWKGVDAPELEVVLPGGSAGGRRQTFPGTPELVPGKEYVLFLWTSRASGLTHVMGLSQGIFTVRHENGEMYAYRGPSAALILNRSGRPVRDLPVSARMADFRQRVRAALVQGGMAQ